MVDREKNIWESSQVLPFYSGGKKLVNTLSPLTGVSHRDIVADIVERFIPLPINVWTQLKLRISSAKFREN